MKTKKFFALMLVAVLAVSCLFAQSINEIRHGDMYGKTVILHSNDVHGAIEGYAKIAALRDSFIEREASVFLVDAGDFSQGTTYVSSTKGLDAITMMNAAGYHVITLGNHEFDYGFEQLISNLMQANFMVLCADIFADGQYVFDPCAILTLSSGERVGFIGLETPEAQTKANPALIKGLDFIAGEDLYAETVSYTHLTLPTN